MNPHPKAGHIRLIAFDVDGIMTDGRLFYGNDGEIMKAFDVQDGLGIKLAQEAGIEAAIITSRRSRIVEHRAADLGIRHLFQGVHNKWEALRELCDNLGMDASAAAFMGDDLVDLQPMRHCGFRVTVPTAVTKIRQIADYITTANAGRGAVRECCELLIASRASAEHLTGKPR